MHNRIVEMQGKCRRLFFAKIDLITPEHSDPITGDVIPAKRELRAGDVVGVASAGGALARLSGNDLIIATFNDQSAPDRIGCIEEFYNPIPSYKPLRVNVTRIGACLTAVDAYRAAKKAEADFVFESGVTMFGAEAANVESFRQRLRVQEVATRGQLSYDTVVGAQTALDALSKTCDECCDALLDARDAAIVFAD